MKTKRVQYCIYKKTSPFPGEYWECHLSEKACRAAFEKNFEGYHESKGAFHMVKVTYEKLKLPKKAKKSKAK